MSKLAASLFSALGDFPAEDQTLEYEHYSGHTIEEDQDNAYEEGLPDNNILDPVSMPDVEHNYISAEVLLPSGSVLQQGKVISHKHNADGKTVGRANERPIFETRCRELYHGTLDVCTKN